MTDDSGRCARRAQGCNENTKFRPVISDWTCYKNYEPCPKDSQVGWCNKCWCNKGYNWISTRLTTDITLTKIFWDESLIYWKIKLQFGQRNSTSPNLKSGYKMKIVFRELWQQRKSLILIALKNVCWDGDRNGNELERYRESKSVLFEV